MGTPERSVTLDPAFKMVVLIVTGVMAVAFLTMIGIAVTGATNDASKNLFDASSHAFSLGLGAIAGLLGGKAL